MTRFNYSAEKKDGEIYRATADVRDRFELYEMIRHDGAKIISVDEDRSTSVFSFSFWNRLVSSVGEYDKILFARNLGAMLSAGLSLSRALSVITRQTSNPKLISVVSDVDTEVRRGETLHAAIAKFPAVFPTLFSAMVRAGEEGGDLAASLTLIADQMERMFNLKKKIRGAMLYPMIIVIAIIGIGAIMMTTVVPTLSATFKEMGAQLPVSTRLVIATSDFLVNNTLLAIILSVATVALFFGSLRTKTGRRIRDLTLIKMPLIGRLVREINAARTARTMSSLLTAGVDVLTSLEITSEVVQNSYFKAVIIEAQEKVRGGEPLSAAFMRHEGLFPPFVGEMMSVGEETGQTPEMLKRLAIYYEDEVDGKTKDMSTIIEPFLMIFIGAAVGFFAMAMITPIYSLSQNI